MASGNVPSANLAALYANTTPSVVADPAVMAAAIQTIVQTINDNWTAFQTFLQAAEVGIADGSVTTRKLRDGAVTQTKIIKEAITQFTYDFAQIDQKIANVVVSNIPQSTIDAIANQVNSQLNTHIASNAKHVPHLGTATNSGNDYSVATGEVISVNQKFTVKFVAASSGPATLNIPSIGSAKAIKKAGGSDANIKVGVYTIFWDGTVFQQLGEGGGGTVQPNQVEAGFTFVNDNGEQVGTLSKQAFIDALVAKGVSATSFDDFITLAAKIGQISTGKKIANGNFAIPYPSAPVNINSLAFRPRTVIALDTSNSYFGLYSEEILSFNVLFALYDKSVTPQLNFLVPSASGFVINATVGLNRNYNFIAFS